MKAIALVVGAGVGAVAALGAKAVAALQANVAALEKRNSDLVLKSQIVSSQLLGAQGAHGFGLDRFFAEPEFWQNTYDSGQADCSNRCIKDLLAAKNACEAKYPEGPERQACIQENLDRATTCHQRCAEAFPTPIP